MAAEKPPAAAEPKWISLFDGKTLAGWKQLGGKARYEVRGGTIVGIIVPEKNNWLNGKLTVEHDDATTARGFFGLQVHAPGAKTDLLGKEVAFRNLRVQKLD